MGVVVARRRGCRGQRRGRAHRLRVPDAKVGALGRTHHHTSARRANETRGVVACWREGFGPCLSARARQKTKTQASTRAVAFEVLVCDQNTGRVCGLFFATKGKGRKRAFGVLGACPSPPLSLPSLSLSLSRPRPPHALAKPLPLSFRRIRRGTLAPDSFSRVRRLAQPSVSSRSQCRSSRIASARPGRDPAAAPSLSSSSRDATAAERRGPRRRAPRDQAAPADSGRVALSREAAGRGPGSAISSSRTGGGG